MKKYGRYWTGVGLALLTAHLSPTLLIGMAAARRGEHGGFLPLGRALCLRAPCMPAVVGRGTPGDWFLGLLPGSSNLLSLSVNGF